MKYNLYKFSYRIHETIEHVYSFTALIVNIPH